MTTDCGNYNTGSRMPAFSNAEFHEFLERRPDVKATGETYEADLEQVRSWSLIIDSARPIFDIDASIEKLEGALESLRSIRTSIDDDGGEVDFISSVIPPTPEPDFIEWEPADDAWLSKLKQIGN